MAIQLPDFTVAHLHRLCDEGYEDALSAGLVALALQCDIEDVLDSPMSIWQKSDDILGDDGEISVPGVMEWMPSEYSVYLGEVGRQFNDGGDLSRNNFTGLATVTLVKPLGDCTEIVFRGAPSARMVVTAANPVTYPHQLSIGLHMIASATGMATAKLMELYVGDYKVLEREINHLTPTPSSS